MKKRKGSKKTQGKREKTPDEEKEKYKDSWMTKKYYVNNPLVQSRYKDRRKGEELVKMNLKIQK